MVGGVGDRWWCDQWYNVLVVEVLLGVHGGGVFQCIDIIIIVVHW